MKAPDHLKISGPEDILGFIPHSLGYWPAHSLVAITMQGTRLGATLRVDLPGSAGGPGRSGPARPVAFARTVASYLAADDAADGSLLAFFTETDGDGARWAPLLAELEDTLAGAGMPVRDAWLVGSGYWRNAYCLDPLCCAPPGRPVEEIRNSRLNAEMVFRGSTVGPAPGTTSSRARAGAPDPAVLEAQRDWAGQFAARTRDKLQFSQVLAVWTQVIDAPAPGPTLAAGLTGYLRASLCVPSWRDAVLVMAAAGQAAAERGAEDFGVFAAAAACSPPATVCATRTPAPLPPLEGFPGERQSQRPEPAGGQRPGQESRGGGAGRDRAAQQLPELPGYGEILLGLAPRLPDWAAMAGLDRVLEQLAAAGGEAAAAALTGQGWIEWCRGKGSFADALFSRANEEHPGYRLAELLAELVRRGTLCGWAGRRETAWQRFAPDGA